MDMIQVMFPKCLTLWRSLVVFGRNKPHLTRKEVQTTCIHYIHLNVDVVFGVDDEIDVSVMDGMFNKLDTR